MKTPTFSRRFAVIALLLALLPGACASGAPDSTNAKTSAPVAVGKSLFGNYLAGRHAQAARDPAAAIAFVLDALAKDPQNLELVRRAFLLLLSEGRNAEAAIYAERLVAAGERTPFPALHLAVMEMKAGRYAEAIARAGEIPDGALTAYVAPLIRAWSEFGRGRPDDGLGALAVLAARKEAQGLVDMHQALLLDAAGRGEAARPHYEKLAAAPDGVSLRIAELLGTHYERAGEADKAKALYERYLDRNPDSRLIAPATRRLATQAKAPPLEIATAAQGAAEGLYGIASSFRQQNARETALLLVQLALELRPDYPVAQILLADILESDRRPADANGVYARIEPNSPFSRPARMRIAVNLDRLDRTEEAVAGLRKLAAEDKSDPEPMVQLGDILRARKRFAEAADAYDVAVAALPRVERQHWAILYSRGIAYERSNQWPKAEADFLKALEFEPDQPYVLNYLGYSWVEQGKNLDRALEMLKKAVSLRPNDGYIIDSLGWVFYKLGDIESAVKELERAVELRPDDPVINDHLGDALWRVGRRNEARFQWERALGLKPEADVIEGIKKKLEQGLSDPPSAKRDG